MTRHRCPTLDDAFGCSICNPWTGPQDPEQNTLAENRLVRKTKPTKTRLTKKKPFSELSEEEKQKRLKQILLGGLGKAWMFWPPRLEAKKRAKHPDKSGWYICEMCKGEREKVEIDHVIPCVKPADGFTTWDEYINSRFVSSADKLQALCRECHKAKTKEENRLRRLK